MTEQRNSVNGQINGPVVQVGDVAGDVRVSAVYDQVTMPARSRYLEQVRQIAPEELVGRLEELAALADFCAARTGPGYLWWRAPRWAGKTALLSWFVLHPPQGVRVVSFFVTGRLAGQDRRDSCVTVLLEQLADMLCEPSPVSLPAPVREHHLAGLLAEAAARCEDHGERLVLVVDGIDEDRGYRSGPGGQSIAALLPTRPPAGLRVVVSGRPNPPLPADLDRKHPLRDPAVIRSLVVSSAAGAARDDMEVELHHLLLGDDTDFLAFLVAARGGLSARDLAELTGTTEPAVAARLRTVAGRSFDVRPTRWRASAGEVYLLGHEELHTIAAEYLGFARIARYRDRLHTWADTYRRNCWPADTPEYLLRGYFRLLDTHDDVPRLVQCAGDRHRHDRIRESSGGDVAALAEIAAAQDRLVASVRPDLAALVRLAILRDRLVKRNVSVPDRLPALWVAVGQPHRAEALVDPVRNPEAAVHYAKALADAGDVNAAEVAACRIVDLEHSTTAMVNLAESMAAGGRVVDALALVAAMIDPGSQVEALTQIAARCQETGDLARARELCAQAKAKADTITSDYWREAALVRVAYCQALLGENASAEAMVDSIATRSLRAQGYRYLIWAAQRSGDETGPLASSAVKALDGWSDHDTDWEVLVRVLVDAGAADRAAQLVNELRNPSNQATALAALIESTSDSGAVDEAVNRAALEKWPPGKVRVVLDAVARAGDERATTIAGDRPDLRARAYVGLAEAALAKGDTARARALAERASAVGCLQEDGERPSDLRVLLDAALARNAPDLVALLVNRLSSLSAGDPNESESHLALVRAFAADGSVVKARHLAARIEDDRARAQAMGVLAVDAIARGEGDHAARIALSVDDPERRAALVHRTLTGLVAAGSIGAAEDLADAIVEPARRMLAWRHLVRLSPATLPRAEAVVRALPEVAWQTCLLADLVAVADGAEARRLLDLATQTVRAMRNPFARVRALLALAMASREQSRSLLAQAVPAASMVPDAAWRFRAVLDVVSTALAVADHAAATAAAALFPLPGSRDPILVLFFRSAVAADDLNRAEEFLAAITRARERDECLLFLVRAHAATGDLDSALSTMDRIAGVRARLRANHAVIRATAIPGLLRTESLERILAHIDCTPDTVQWLAKAATIHGLVPTSVLRPDIPLHLRARFWHAHFTASPTQKAAAQLLSMVPWAEALPDLAAHYPELVRVACDEYVR